MSFNSTEFIFFFLGVFFLYWSLARFDVPRFVLLFVASAVFYMSWNAKFILLILFSATLDFFLGRAIHASSKPGKRRLLLSLSLCGNLGLLGFFKYFNFFAENWVLALQKVGLNSVSEFVPWDIVLPVGISFYTFQTLSYTIDIYRGQLEPTRSFLRFGLFVSFFPQLVAGPIVRARDFLPQLEQPASYSDQRASKGLFLILLGLIKKVALADAIGVELVDPVFAKPELYAPAEIWLGVCGALFQFYLDFSAYSDIAIGCAAMLGFSLCENFDRPFLSESISEFWRRWHISLSTWFRDYVFFPLGGTRASGLGRFRNIMVTMLLTGLWHGAGWNYVIWGVFHGLLTWWGTLFAKRSGASGSADPTSIGTKFMRRLWTFNLVSFSMLFFRNGTLAEGNLGVQGSWDMLLELGAWDRAFHGLEKAGLLAIGVAALIHFTPKAWVHRSEVLWLRLPSLAQALVLVCSAGVLSVVAYNSPFIYFQF